MKNCWKSSLLWVLCWGLNKDLPGLEKCTLEEMPSIFISDKLIFSSERMLHKDYYRNSSVEPGNRGSSTVGRCYQAQQWRSWLRTLVYVWQWFVKCIHELCVKCPINQLPIQTQSIVTLASDSMMTISKKIRTYIYNDQDLFIIE
jgi:hypothetical protein